jgi:hypothetical protein
MKLPNAESAIVELDKLRNYSLNPHHSRGKHKARLFAAILGLAPENAEELQAILLQVVQTCEAVLSFQDQHGQRYVIDFPLTRQNQQAIVRSTWIVRSDETFPRLTSCYILR